MASGVPGYVRRYTRVLRALEVLAYYPDGLPLQQLAEELGTTPDALRTEILAYYLAEPASGAGAPMPGVGWLSPSGTEDDPALAELVVLTNPQALADLGVVRMTVDEMATVWRAGRILASYEPDNEVLAEALDVLGEGWFDGPAAEAEPGAELVSVVRAAIEGRQRISMTYAREWRPGITERVVDPYRLICTSRGWELDAGPLDDTGDPRTFLLANVQDLHPLAETFEPPAGILATLDEHRARLRVEVSLPQRLSWGADSQADSVEVVRSDEETTTLRVTLSPPYGARLALIMAPALGDGMLMTERQLGPQVGAFASRLLEHHGF